MRLAPALFLLAAAGCARDDTPYPSLAPRAIEKVSFTEPAVAAPAPVVADPVLDARLADATARLAKTAAGFDADAARAARATAAAGARAAGSDAWIAAQSALAALDDWRAQLGGLTTELDDLGRDRVAAVGTAYATLDDVRDRVGKEAERESARITALGARVPTP